MSGTSVICLVPTLNEALHVERAVRSLLPLGRVVVVDAGSSDDTVALARAAGAEAVVHAWEGYAAQKNWALDTVAADAEWVLFLDADETIEAELVAEIEHVLAAPQHDGYYLARRNYFLGRELKHVWWYPDYQMRLFRIASGRYEDRAVHEHVVVDGSVGYLQGALLHENLKGIDAFLERHIRYAAFEAQELVDGGSSRLQVRGSWFGDKAARRRALKQLWYRLPHRPLLRFLWLYVVRRGFLDGREGRVYAQLIAAYEAMIDAKVAELRAGRPR